MSYSSHRIGLTVLEAAWLLSTTESQILQLIALGTLEAANEIGLISIRSVQNAFPVDPVRPLRERALERLLAGEVTAYELADPSGEHSVHEVIQATLIASLRPIHRRRTGN